MVPVIAFVGRHNSGKTTLLCRIIGRLQERRIECAVIKHSHHLLTPDSYDSGKLYAAGAKQVYLSTPQETLIYLREEQPWIRFWAKLELQQTLYSWKDLNNPLIPR